MRNFIHGTQIFLFVLFFFLFVCETTNAHADQSQNATKEVLRILTWEGYVTADDLINVNRILQKQGYDFEARVIAPYAEGAEQMFDLIRTKKADISFLTLFFIKLQNERTSNLLQPINTASPRLANYKYLARNLTRIPMGMHGDKPLYIPFCGGSYGFYANRKVIAEKDLPKSWNDLLKPQWKGRYSLNRSQIWYNIAIASMASGKAPYYLNALAVAGKRNALMHEVRNGGVLSEKLSLLYRNAGAFWDAAPSFSPNLQIVSSWGTEVKLANKDGGDWRRIDFKEGDLVWMDTINFMSELKGKKLEAAEIVANYFIGKNVQSRVAGDLSLVSVSSLAETNPILREKPDFFTRGTFVPPYHVMADNIMTQLSDDTFKKTGVKK